MAYNEGNERWAGMRYGVLVANPLERVERDLLLPRGELLKVLLEVEEPFIAVFALRNSAG